jgi:phospholipase C
MSMSKIEHVILLMLEDRSFDSLLGWLCESRLPLLNIPPAAPGDEFRGLAHTDLSRFVNKARDGTLAFAARARCRRLHGADARSG